MGRRIPLLSVHPEHASSIFEGRKKVELRRKCPELSDGEMVVVYVTSPRKAVEGIFLVAGVVKASPDNLWLETEKDVGLTREQFKRYYKGAKVGYGIRIREAFVLPEPVSLEDLKARIPGFNVPQNYRYLDAVELQACGIDLQGRVAKP